MDINDVIDNFQRSYSSRTVTRVSRSSDGIYVIEAPETNDDNQETSNMFIGDGTRFAPFNPVNDLDGYVKLMSKVTQVWPQQVIVHSAIARRWR